VTPIFSDENQGSWAAKDRKERKKQDLYPYAIAAFFCG